jgi:uncharacterized protein (DUF2237 family)
MPRPSLVLSLVAAALAGCASGATADLRDGGSGTSCALPPPPSGSATLLLGAPAADPTARSVDGEPLAVCSLSPRTGFYRDGRCATGPDDRGSHTVCAKVTAEFLAFTASRGNDLSTPRGEFPGLSPGDAWCLCSARWAEADAAGKAPPVRLEATHEAALRVAPRERLEALSVTPREE